MKNIAPLAFIILLLNHISIYGQNRLTLEMCIDYGMEHNADILTKELEMRQFQNEHIGSFMEFIPEVNNISSWHIYPHRELSSSMEMSFTIFNGLSRYNNIRSTRSALHASKDNMLDTRERVSIAITKAYLELLLSYEMVQISQDGYDMAVEQYYRSKVLYENGKSSYSTLLEIESQKSSEMVKLVNAQNSLASSQSSLSRLINYPPSEDFSIFPYTDVDMDSSKVELSYIDTLYKSALDLPYITSARHELEMRKYEAKVVSGMLLPSISLNVGYDMTNFRENVGIGVTIPIFNKGSLLKKAKNSNLMIKKSEVELEKRISELYREISHHVREGISLYQQYLASKDYLKSAEESFRFTMEKFNIGMATSTDYSHSKNNLTKAKSELAQAKYRYIFQLKVLEYYRCEK